MDTDERLARLEAKLDTLLMLVANGKASVESYQAKAASYAESFFRQFTLKQNLVLQMLLRGATNEHIAERFKVTENTSKVHVRAIAKKLNVSTRAQIVIKAMDSWNEIDDASYRLALRGLPKDWDQTFKEPDPFSYLYGGGNEFEAGTAG